MQHTSACEDCIVTAVLDRGEDDEVVLDLEQAGAVRELQRAGLAPLFRFVPVDRSASH
jgi:hypothetical protein